MDILRDPAYDHLTPAWKAQKRPKGLRLRTSSFLSDSGQEGGRGNPTPSAITLRNIRYFFLVVSSLKDDLILDLRENNSSCDDFMIV